MIRKLTLTLVAGLGSLTLALAAPQETAQAADSKADSAAQEAEIAHQLPSYPLKTCVVSGEGLHDMGEPVDMLHDGKLVRLCCKGCKKTFAKSPERFVKEIDAAVVAAQAPSYPLDTCVVSGEGLASMGGPISHVHGTRLVQLCCDGCLKSVKKNPEKAIAKIDAALIEKQAADYPLDKCVVSGEPLKKPHDVLVGTTLVRTCCSNCEKPVRKNPMKFVAKVEEAASKG